MRSETLGLSCAVGVQSVQNQPPAGEPEDGRQGGGHVPAAPVSAAQGEARFAPAVGWVEGGQGAGANVKTQRVDRHCAPRGLLRKP